MIDVRRVQRVGYSTFTVSLPIRWVKRVGLKKGDCVTIEIQKDDSLRMTKTASSDVMARIDCPGCGALIPGDSKFCKECGEHISSS